MKIFEKYKSGDRKSKNMYMGPILRAELFFERFKSFGDVFGELCVFENPDGGGGSGTIRN